LESILLTSADYYGTLAAARHLGSRGVQVTMADARRFAPASWSRHVSARLRSPASFAPQAMLDWLLDLGARHPGQVLLPTNDDLAWLFSRARERLSKDFRLYSPPASTMAVLLDKRRLHEAAAAVGLPTPRTWYPADEGEVAALADYLPYPIILKPRTQVYSRMASKGVRIDGPAELLPHYRALVAAFAGREAVADRIPDTERPMLQAFHSGVDKRIYEVSGFTDASGAAFVARAAYKVVQRPRRMGIGLCFEEAPLDQGLVERIARLCQEVGFYGIFNIEFLMGEDLYLIDFNPRMYNQMAFDIARGLPLPWLAYLAATGREDQLLAEAARARGAFGPPRVFCNWFSTFLLLNAQVMAGAIPAADKERWHRWYLDHRALAVDPVADGTEWMPLVLDVAHQVFDTVRHARHFVRQLGLDAPRAQAAATGSPASPRTPEATCPKPTLP
jgi:D-aspartate ligase